MRRHARATPELHGAVRSGTVGRGPNRDHRQWTGRGGLASTHAHLGTAGRETILGIAGCGRAGGAARLGADLHVYACPPAPPWHRRPRESAGPARGPWAAAACGRAGGAV
jgi:hypothetical protein